jgi:hypothetical protein
VTILKLHTKILRKNEKHFAILVFFFSNTIPLRNSCTWAKLIWKWMKNKNSSLLIENVFSVSTNDSHWPYNEPKKDYSWSCSRNPTTHNNPSKTHLWGTRKTSAGTLFRARCVWLRKPFATKMSGDNLHIRPTFLWTKLYFKWKH